jgi:hypothetical protein
MSVIRLSFSSAGGLGDKLDTTESFTEKRRRWGRDAGSVLIRALPILVGFVAYKAAGDGITEGSDPALQNITNVLQWAIGLIAGIAVYTLIGELTIRRLPTQISKELSATGHNIHELETQITELREIASEQFRIFTDLQGLEIVYEFDDALRKARNLLSSANASVSAMWTLLPYDDALRSYFNDTLATCPFTKRVIDIGNISRDDLFDHIEASWEHLASHRYEIYLVRDCNYEAMVVDRKHGALFFNSERGFGSCYLSINTDDFGRVIEGLVEGLVTMGTQLPVTRNATIDVDKLNAWLDTQY